MTRENLIRELAQMTAAASPAPDRSLPPHAGLRLREDAGLESLGFIDLIVAIEEQHQIILDPTTSDFERGFQTLGSLADLIISVISSDGA